MTDSLSLLGVLAQAQVDVIVIGGVAGVAHGSSRVTVDLDCVYSRAPSNIARLVHALAPFTPTLRGAQRGFHSSLTSRPSAPA